MDVSKHPSPGAAHGVHQGPIDPSRLLLDLALAEYVALGEHRAGHAAGLVEAQRLVREHAGIPTGPIA
jgi:hypothetical protein